MSGRKSLFVWCLALAACGAPLGADAGPTDDAGGDSGLREAGLRDAGLRDAAGPETAEVSHQREVRGVWIATVWNINWPSATSLSAADQRAELDGLLDAAAAVGMNAVFLQIRAEGDALYRSDLEPWSRFLTGRPGQDPGWDPLAHAVEAAHARGLELHAWMNPYRALVSGGPGTAAATHAVNARPDLLVRYGELTWFDPGNPDARAHTLAVIRDVLTRYDVDGLHFDDYFYPYPEAGIGFDDDASFAAYGGGLSRADWRRQNVNEMVSAVHDLVREARSRVRFGISPFGIYRPGMPAGIRGLDQYDALYADPLTWMRAGTVDYIAPQLYWPTTRAGQDYARLLGWWAERAEETGTHLLVGNYLSQLGSSAEWSRAEIARQLRLVREEARAQGNIQYQIQPILEDRDGVRALFEAHYETPAATPAIPGATAVPSLPELTVEGATVRWDRSARYLAAYREVDRAWVIERLIVEAQVTLYRGRWAFSAIGRDGLESLGVVVTISEGEPPLPPPPTTGRSCTHSLGGRYSDQACSNAFQCCDGAWVSRDVGCGVCACLEPTGETGC